MRKLLLRLPLGSLRAMRYWTKRRDRAQFQLKLLDLRPEKHSLYSTDPEFFNIYYWTELFEDSWDKKDWATCKLILQAKYGRTYLSSLRKLHIFWNRIPFYLKYELFCHTKLDSIITLFAVISIPISIVSWVIVITATWRH